MTLQNKKLGLLDKDDSASDIPDLFDQYGSGDDDVFAVPQNTTVPTDYDVTRPKKDDETDDVDELEEEKVWEQDFEEPVQKASTDVQEPIKVTPVVEKKQNKEMETESKETESESEVIAKPSEEKDNGKTVELSEDALTQKAKKSLRPEIDKPTRKIEIDPSKKTIMIVDDDIDTLEMYADVFENADYNIIRAADGLEGLSMLNEHTPHVIFTGIVMPRMDGFTMMESINQNKRTADIPVVINSHLGRDTDKDKAEELGAKDFIIRGFTQPKEVVERIGALLLKNEYTFYFNKTDKDARQLSKDLGNPNFLQCPRGQKMAIKLKVQDERELTFSARFSCVDDKK